MPESATDLLAKTLQGDPRATRGFVRALRPVVQARVARILLRFSGRSAGREIRQEVDDLTQDVFAQLFADDARVIRRWSSEKGLSLANFVGLVAQRHATKVLLSARRSPWSEEPTLAPDLDRAQGAVHPEDAIIHRDMLVQVLKRVRAEMSPRAQLLFEVLLVQRLPIAEVVEMTGLGEAALYQWRSRLAKRVRAIGAALAAEAESAPDDRMREARR